MATLVASLFLAGQTEHLVQPLTVDSTSGAPNTPHHVYINKGVALKGKLFLFFPGSGSSPRNYTEVLRHAANLGYHAIGLSYPNAEVINRICLASSDTTCHSRARLEIFDGLDRHDDIQVDSVNSVQARTRKLLGWLHQEYPDANWGQFLNGRQIQWAHVILSGHSQGGGHAGFISKIKGVDRVVMFASMEWMFPLDRTADWVTWEGPTPGERYYGFAHERDPLVTLPIVQRTWEALNMDAFGNLVLVDTVSPPYHNSHMLYTSVPLENGNTRFHGSVVSDNATPRNADGPVFAPVWTYLIQGTAPPTSTGEIEGLSSLRVFPNPTISKINVECPSCEMLTFELFDSGGRILRRGKVHQATVDLSAYSKGYYLLRIYAGKSFKTIPLIKR